jgi:four helix bundle protein
MTQSIICGRAFEFAVRIVKVCEKMAAHGFGARHIAKQLIRCGTSIGANAEEAQEGQSKADYVAKMCISSKEARETGYWLRLAIAVSCVKRGEVEWRVSEISCVGIA